MNELIVDQETGLQHDEEQEVLRDECQPRGWHDGEDDLADFNQMEAMDYDNV